MTTVEYDCHPDVSGSGSFFTLRNPVNGKNISLDGSIMQGGAARHQYVSPLLPSANPFIDAELFVGEEVVLGILSLFIISLISSLVYDILLRAGHNSGYSTRSISIAAALESVERWGFQSHHVSSVKQTHHPNTQRSRLWYKGIIFVILLASVTFALEVALIAATQEVDVETSGDVIGFGIKVPVVTHWGTGQFLRRNAPTRPCVTPSISGGGVEWKARVQTCITANYTDSVSRNIPYSGQIVYRSFYHRRGGDHYITAEGLDLTYAVSVRAKIYREEVAPADILSVPGSLDADTALLVHLTAPIYYHTNQIRLNSDTCNETSIPPLSYKHSVAKGKHSVSQTEEGPVFEDARIYSTEFKLDVDDIEWWMVQALGSAAASLGIVLTNDAEYLVGRTGKTVRLSDEVVYVRKERRCAAVTLVLLLVGLIAVKIVLRRCLKPLPLYEVARIKAMEAAGQDPTGGLREEPALVHIDMGRAQRGLSAIYGGPYDDIMYREDLSYEEAGRYYIGTES